MSPTESIHRENSIIEKIGSGDRIYLRELYQKYRKEFGSWVMKHYQVDDDEAGEVYQKSFITLYCNIQEGKLTQLNSSIKTYLFAIGKNLLRDHFKSGKRFVDTMEVNIESNEIDDSIMEQYEQSSLKTALSSMLNEIGEPCKTVLELFYFHQYSMDSIAVELNYKTEQIAAKRKFICLKQLRSMIEQNSGQYEI